MVAVDKVSFGGMKAKIEDWEIDIGARSSQKVLSAGSQDLLLRAVGRYGRREKQLKIENTNSNYFIEFTKGNR